MPIKNILLSVLCLTLLSFSKAYSGDSDLDCSKQGLQTKRTPTTHQKPSPQTCFGLALKNIENPNGNTRLAMAGFSKMPPSYVSLAYIDFLLKKDPGLTVCLPKLLKSFLPLWLESDRSPNLPQEASQMVQASESWQRFQNVAIEPTVMEKYLNTRAEAQCQSCNTLSLDQKVLWINPRLLIEQALFKKELSKNAIALMLMNLCQKDIVTQYQSLFWRAFSYGAFDVYSYVDDTFLKSNNFLQSSAAQQEGWTEKRVYSLLLMKERVAELVKERKQEHEIFDNLVETLPLSWYTLVGLSCTYDLFRPLSDEEVNSLFQKDTAPPTFNILNGLNRWKTPAAYVALAKLYEKGFRDQKPDLKKAIPCYEKDTKTTFREDPALKTIDENSVYEACLSLGQIYLYTKDYQDLNKALQLFQQAHELNPNNINPLSLQGDTLVSLGKIDEGVSWFKRAAQQQDPDSSYQLFCLYAQGHKQINADEALNYLNNCLKNPDFYTLKHLIPFLNQHPELVEKLPKDHIFNTWKNLKCEKKSGILGRLVYMGWLKSEGLYGTTENIAEAQGYYQEAAQKGSHREYAALAHFKHSQKNTGKAIKIYTQLVKERYLPAFNALGTLYMNSTNPDGRKTKKGLKGNTETNDQKAFNLFKELITKELAEKESNDPVIQEAVSLAKVNIARLWMNKRIDSDDMNDQKALQYLEESTDTSAKAALATVYYNGTLGQEPDLEKAISYAEQSLGEGEEPCARINLAVMLRNQGRTEDQNRINELLDECITKLPGDPVVALQALVSYLEGDRCSKKLTSQIESFFKLVERHYPPESQYLKGKAVLAGKYLEKDVKQATTLILQALPHLSALLPNYTQIAETFIHEAQAQEDTLAKDFLLQQAYKLVQKQTDQDPQMNNPETGQACFIRALLADNLPEALDYAKKSKEKGFPGATDLYQDLRTQEEEYNQTEENPIAPWPSVDSTHTPKDKDYELGSKVKWDMAHELLQKYVLSQGGSVSSGAGSRIKFIVNGTVLCMHRPHGKEGNPIMDPGRMKSIQSFMQKQ